MISSRKEDSGSASQTQGAHGSTKKTRFPIHITTFNMGPPSDCHEPPDQRRELIRTTLETLRPSLLFCQELPGRFEKEIIDNKDYEFQKNEKEAGVVWHKEYIEECGDSPKTTDAGIREIRDRLSASGEEVIMNELLSRVAMVKLKDKQSGEKVLAVSWHGRWKGCTNEKKKEGFWGLVHFCQKVSKYVGDIPFIIGGDFNFNTSTLDKSLLSKEGITRSTYELSERAQEASFRNHAATPYKDTFVFSRGIVLKDVKSFEFSTTSGRRPEKDPVKLLDHDPISAVLSFEGMLGVPHSPGAPRDEDLPDLQTSFDSLSLQSTVASARQDSRFSRRRFRGGRGDGAGWEG